MPRLATGAMGCETFGSELAPPEIFDLADERQAASTRHVVPSLASGDSQALSKIKP
jgi:hypothetical protein